MPLVVDASCAAAWCLPDEQAPTALAVLARLGDEGALVPALFWFEIRNLHMMAERRGRITPAYSDASIADLGNLPLEVDARPSSDQVIALARLHGLTVYDAAYLELAQRRGLPLATLDGRLAAAARVAGVGLLEG
jgi:predicted nucleic acid-binding protein